MERVQRIMKDFVKHTQWANEKMVLQTKSEIKNEKVYKFAIGICCRDLNRRLVLQQGRKIENKKPLNKTSLSLKTLKDFLNRPAFWATDDETRNMLLKSKLVVKHDTRDSKWVIRNQRSVSYQKIRMMRKQIPKSSNNQTLSFYKVQHHASWSTLSTDLT